MWDTLDNLLAEAVEHLVARVFGCSVQLIRAMINNNERPRLYRLNQSRLDDVGDVRRCLARVLLLRYSQRTPKGR